MREKILNAALNTTKESDAKTLFFKSISFPGQTVCKYLEISLLINFQVKLKPTRSLKRIGGVWTKGQCCNEVDGDKGRIQ